MGLSRRKFLTGLAAVTGAGVLAPGSAALARRSRTIVRTATATRTGEYIYLTFRVPRGVNRVAVALTNVEVVAFRGLLLSGIVARCVESTPCSRNTRMLVITNRSRWCASR